MKAEESWKREQTNCVLTLLLPELFVCLESASADESEGGAGGMVIANH